MRRSAIIVANGPIASRPDLRARLRSADLLICADGGLRAAKRFGVPPHLVVGDLDSSSPSMVRWAAARGARLLRYPVTKEKIDAELALDAAIDHGVTDVEFIGALGGRLDHTLAAVGLLTKAESAGVRAQIIDGKQEVFLAQQVTTISGRRGDIVSLIPLTARVTGITLNRFRYPLKDATIRQGTTLTISNVLEANPATIRVGQGRLLVLVIHK